MNHEKKVVLERTLQILKTIGSANDAEDHGFLKDAKKMRVQSCQALHQLISENEHIKELLPTLQDELDSGHILRVGWSDLYSIAEEKLRYSNCGS